MSATLIIGSSGSGKSSSIRNLDPKTSILIKVIDKDLPFKGGRKLFSKEAKNSIINDDPNVIIAAIEKIASNPEITTLVIDDAQYIMANMFMKRAKDKGFEKFTDIGESFWRVIKTCISVREDLDIFILTHSEESDFGKIKMKTIGKMLDDKIVMEGMFTIVLRSDYEDGKYIFRTKTNGNDPVKAPMGLFEEDIIDNDLLLVKTAIMEYYK